jgi:hypothetical protein
VSAEHEQVERSAERFAMGTRVKDTRSITIPSAATTRAQFKQVFNALRALMAPPETPKRPIGFATPREDKGKGAKSSGRPT